MVLHHLAYQGDNMAESGFVLTVLGARGSIPVSGSEYIKYGGATSCYMLEVGNQVVFLDAGTGIIDAPNLDDKEGIYVVMSHPHLDHIIGLPFFPELSKKDRTITLYGRNMNGKSIEAQIEKAYSPPYWPLTIAEYPSNFVYEDLELPLSILNGKDVILIEGMEVRHPGGCLALSVTYESKKVVYITDCEIGDNLSDRLVEFTRKADVLLCDAQYTSAEYANRKGFGHSTPQMAKELYEASGAKRLLLIHHDPKHRDSDLEKMEKETGDANIAFARNGMRIQIT